MSKELVVPTGRHSPLGPSSSKRWSHCPGSVNASKNAPDDESIFAAEGSAAHYLSELVRKEKRPATDWKGWTFKAGKHSFEVDDEMIESVNEFVDWCEEVPAEHVLVEELVDYSEYIPEPLLTQLGGEVFGTLDDARVKEHWCTITDFKHGKGVQEFAKNNTQLMLQALGVHIKYGWIYEINAFELRISQPRLNHKDEWTIHLSQLLEWAKTKLPMFCAAVEMGLLFEAGDWCKFCRIRRKCAVRQNSSLKVVFDDLDAIDKQAVVPALPVVAEIPPERRAKILPLLPMLKAWVKEFERDTMERMWKGEQIEGWKLVEGRSNRRWAASEDEVYELLVEAKLDPYERKLLSPAKVETALGKKVFRQLLASKGEDAKIVEKPPGKPKLAPGDDKKPALSGERNAELVFDSLDDDE